MSTKDLKLVVVYRLEDWHEDLYPEGLDIENMEPTYLPEGGHGVPEVCAIGETVSFVCGDTCSFDTSHGNTFRRLSLLSREKDPRIKVQQWIDAQPQKPTLEAITTYALLEAADLTMSELTKILADNKFISAGTLAMVAQKRKQRDGK